MRGKAMARRTSKKVTRRPTTGIRRGGRRIGQKAQLRWFHLVAACVGAFFLGYLVAAAQITSYAAAVFAGPQAP